MASSAAAIRVAEMEGSTEGERKAVAWREGGGGGERRNEKRTETNRAELKEKLAVW